MWRCGYYPHSGLVKFCSFRSCGCCVPRGRTARRPGPLCEQDSPWDDGVECAGMPNAADMPMLLERRHNDGVELTWPAQPSNGSGPILYLVSSRSNIGRHFRDVDVTSWQLLTKVSFTSSRCIKKVKGKGSPYSIAEHRVAELIPVLGSQPVGDVNHKPGGRLPLLAARPAVTLTTLKRAATSFAAW